MTEHYDLVIHAPRAITPDGEVACTVAVRAETIAAVADFGADLLGDRVLRLSADEVLLPGLVDTHVHVNDPGRTEWEGFVSATRAAAAGGVTTIVDMPLNCLPVTTDVAALELKARAAAGEASVDYGFWGGVVPGNGDHLAGLARAGALGFKCFLVPSGIDEFPAVGETDLRY